MTVGQKRVDDDGEKISSIFNRRNTNTPKNSLFLRRDPYPAVERKKRLVMMMIV